MTHSEKSDILYVLNILILTVLYVKASPHEAQFKASVTLV